MMTMTSKKLKEKKRASHLVWHKTASFGISLSNWNHFDPTYLSFIIDLCLPFLPACSVSDVEGENSCLLREKYTTAHNYV